MKKRLNEPQNHMELLVETRDRCSIVYNELLLIPYKSWYVRRMIKFMEKQMKMINKDIHFEKLWEVQNELG